MFFTSSLTIWIIVTIYYIVEIFAIFVVVKEDRYSECIKFFLGMVFIFIPLSGFLYLAFNYKKIPQAVN